MRRPAETGGKRQSDGNNKDPAWQFRQEILFRISSPLFSPLFLLRPAEAPPKALRPITPFPPVLPSLQFQRPVRPPHSRRAPHRNAPPLSRAQEPTVPPSLGRQVRARSIPAECSPRPHPPEPLPSMPPALKIPPNPAQPQSPYRHLLHRRSVQCLCPAVRLR